LKVRFWGTRGSIPSPGQNTIKYGGNTTCLELELGDGTLIIFDAGTGITRLGQKIVSEQKHNVIHLFFSHSHWDHIQGFPLFKPAYSEDFEIKIYGCSRIFGNLENILTLQMNSEYFPVKFNQLKAKITFEEIVNDEYYLNGARLSCINNNHPGNSNGFKVEEEDKKVVFITDNELLAKNGAATTWNEFVQFCQGADLLIHDSHYLPHEVKDKLGFGHSSYDQAIDLAIQANVKELIFFHHDPDRTDKQIESVLSDFRDKLTSKHIKMKLDAAKEGTKYRI